MQASRILFVAAEKQGGLLLPPRTSMTIVASAANAVLNLFSSEDQRKRFASLVNSGVISPEVLGQANLSYCRILALHDELDSPMLKEYNFNVNEFLEGVKPALEQLHEVQANLQNKLNEIATATSDDDKNDDDDDDIMDLTDRNMLPSMLFPNPDTDKIVRRLLKKKHSWKEVAQKDPESDEARLIAMLSPPHLERFELASKLSFGFAPYFHDLNVQVHNVALLSARAIMMDEDDESLDDDSITDEEAQQKVLDNEESGKLPAVAAQIEVLYDVEETLVVPAEPVDTEENKTNADGNEDKKETKTVTRTNVVVGVFEGWLSGGDDSEEELRWRVADVRFPFEFPLISTRGLH